jgi:hypothetical protein
MNAEIQPADATASSRPQPEQPRPMRLLGFFPLALGCVAGILVCAVGFVVLTLLHDQPQQRALPAPQPAASAVCSALQKQDYAGLYGLLSSAQRSTGTAQQFAASQRQLDIAEGSAQTCAASVRVVDGGQANVVFVVSRTVSGGKSGTARMVYEQGAWKLDAYDSQVV